MAKGIRGFQLEKALQVPKGVLKKTVGSALAIALLSLWCHGKVSGTTMRVEKDNNPLCSCISSCFLITDYPKSCTVDEARGKVTALKKACGIHLEKGIVCICT